MKTKTRITVLSCVIAVIFCVLGTISIKYASNLLYSERVEFLSELTKRTSGTIKENIVNSLETMTAISRSITFDGYESDSNTLKEILEAQKNASSFSYLAVYDANGVDVVSKTAYPELREQEWFTKAFNGQSGVSNRILNENGIYINICTVPIYTKESPQINYILMAHRSTDDIRHIYNMEIDSSGYISFLIASDGEPVVYPAEGVADGFENNFFDELQNIGLPNDKLDELKASIEAGRSGSMQYNRDGESRMLFYSPVGIEDWQIVLVAPSALIYSNSYALLQIMTIVIATLAVLLILLVIGIFFFNSKREHDFGNSALIDSVTKLGSWSKFVEDSHNMLSENLDRRYAMVIFDVDRFKAINDVFGYTGGNDCLKFMADNLRTQFGKDSTFVRSSADRFNLIMPYTSDENIIKRLIDYSHTVEKYFEGHKIELSFGVYKIDEPVNNVNMSQISSMSDKATLAKEKAKNAGIDKVVFFNTELRDKLLLENDILASMESALEHHEFEIYIQPIYLFSTSKMIGGEALVRWNRKGKAMYYPDMFIPLFERNGFIEQLDYYVFDQVCRLLQRWKSDPSSDILADLVISVNLSRVHIFNPTLTEDLLNIAAKYGVKPFEIELELTESTAVEDTQLLNNVVNKLSEAGFIIAIDDFGSGFSSLNLLRNLPVDIIKLDREFLSSSADDEKGKSIIVSLISMAKNIGMCVVAEGVELKEQVNFLKAAKCDIAQGYYYEKPMPVAAFEQVVKEQYE